MEPAIEKLPPTAQLRALESWRGAVLRGMLTVGAVAAPLVVIVSVAFRSVPYPWPRIATLSAAAAAFPLLRYAPRLSVATRASLTIGVCFVAGVTSLITFGFTSGSGIALLGTGIFAVIFLGRLPGLLMVALSVAAFLAIGVLNARGVLTINRTELDPALMTNWVRIGVAFSCLASLLTTAVEYVIRHVEHSSRAATDALRDLRLAYERLALMHERLDDAKEEERRFIASELHDDLGQILTVIKLRLRMGEAPAAAETVALVDQAIDAVRKILRDLRPPWLEDVGLIRALRDHLETQSALAGIPITLEAAEDGALRLPPGLEIACFRIVQEAVTNALRHAAPTRIRIEAARRDATIALTIVDDGRGFDVSSMEGITAGHLGIIGMRERARTRGGTFRIESRLGAGTRVEVELPLDAAATPV